MNAVDGDTHVNFSAALADQPSHMFPKLTGTELGIKKLLDERSLCLLLSQVARLFASEGLLEEVQHYAFERQALDALGAPLGADLIARHAPDLFGIRLEEDQIQLLAKPVDNKVLERALLALRQDNRAHVTQSTLDRADQPHASERSRAQTNGIVEEPAQKINPALARAHKHHAIFCFRIGRLRGSGKFALLAL